MFGPRGLDDELDIIREGVPVWIKAVFREHLVMIGYELNDPVLADMFIGKIVAKATRERFFRQDALDEDRIRMEGYVQALMHTGVYLRNLPDNIDPADFGRKGNPHYEFFKGLGIWYWQ